VHFLRDSTLALPVSIAVLMAVALAVRRLGDGVPARLGFAVGAAVVAAAVSVPEVLVHGGLFGEHVAGVSLTSHLTGVALVTLRYTFALILAAVVLFGVPWRTRTTHQPLQTITDQPVYRSTKRAVWDLASGGRPGRESESR
jgi:hypothetical protein